MHASDQDGNAYTVRLKNGTLEACSRDKLTHALPSRAAARARASEANLVKALLAASPSSASATDKAGQLPLHEALRHVAAPGILELLLAANPSAASTADSAGNLPLHLALAYDGEQDTIAALLAAHKPAADVASKETGEFPLHTAVKKGRPLVVVAALLESAGADGAGKVDRAGDTALHSALRDGCEPGVLEALLEAHPAAAAVTNLKGETALHAALRYVSPLGREVGSRCALPRAHATPRDCATARLLCCNAPRRCAYSCSAVQSARCGELLASHSEAWTRRSYRKC